MKQLAPIPEKLSFEYCIAYLEKKNWNGKPTCPYCSSKRATRILNEYRYHCNNCNTPYSVTVNTIFHHTHVPLQKWFWAIFLVLASNDRVTGRQLAIVLDINKNTACGMLSAIKNTAKHIRHNAFLEEIANMVNQYIVMDANL